MIAPPIVIGLVYFVINNKILKIKNVSNKYTHTNTKICIRLYHNITYILRNNTDGFLFSSYKNFVL